MNAHARLSLAFAGMLLLAATGARALEPIVVTLEFGPRVEGDPFKANRIRRDNVARAADSNLLHPVIREYKGGRQLSEHHVIEDLEARWKREEHVIPLRRYFEQCLRRLLIPSESVR